MAWGSVAGKLFGGVDQRLGAGMTIKNGILRARGYRGVIGSIRGANMNATTDQRIPIIPGVWKIDRIIVTNASTSLTTAAGGVYTAASKGGTAIVASSQAYSSLVATTDLLELTIAAGTTTRFTAGQLYFALTTAQGSAATADIYIEGVDLS